MKTEDFNYHLPVEMIAQTPAEPRDSSRLLVLDRKSGAISHRVFQEIGNYLNEGDLLVVNSTRVIPARLFGRKKIGGGKLEILLLNKTGDKSWECLVGGKGLKPGAQFAIDHGPDGEILKDLGGSKREVVFTSAIEPFFAEAGHTPLPPYIRSYKGDPERYQTVYNRQEGSAAAPTAGLHFTSALLDSLKARGVGVAEVLLQVGLDTFAPVTEEDPLNHHIHQEWCQLSQAAADLINQTKSRGKRIIAVGTTTVRTLESAASHSPDGKLQPWNGSTGLFILPGYQFQVVNAMITNFHLPKSTLLMLVSAFAGRERILSAYETAKESGYRFFSFGDAMLIQ